MKKIIFTFLLLSSIVSINVRANPITIPPLTSELYFDNNDWQLELFFDMNLCSHYGIYSPDSLFLITSNDTAGFKPDVNIIFNSNIVITKDNLLVPIPINKNGDCLFIAIKQNGIFINLDDGFDEFMFGNYPGSTVTAPLPGQSIKRCQCNFRLVKDSNPSLWCVEFTADATSSVEGYVYDSNHNPFPGASIIGIDCLQGNIVSDANGHFQFYGIYAFYENIYAYSQFCDYQDTSLIFEPDSTHHLEFIFDSCTVGIDDFSKINNYSLQVFPNPGSGNFTFTINFPYANGGNQCIKIYNIAGELVNIIPVVCDNNTMISVTWDGKGKYSELSPGVYLCILEINGQKVSSQKLIIN
jgi:hypothetical protein